jgi:hypothetical protein
MVVFSFSRVKQPKKNCSLSFDYVTVDDEGIHPTIHLWRYSPFRALASLISRLHSSLFAALLLHPLIPSSCSASL